MKIMMLANLYDVMSWCITALRQFFSPLIMLSQFNWYYYLFLKNLNVFHATSDDRSSDKKLLKESLKIFCSMEKPCGKTALISQIMYANKFGEAIEYT